MLDVKEEIYLCFVDRQQYFDRVNRTEQILTNISKHNMIYSHVTTGLMKKMKNAFTYFDGIWPLIKLYNGSVQGELKTYD